MNIRIGMKARFCPDFLKSCNDSKAERAAKAVTGIVSYVNWDHRVFTVEYKSGSTIQTEAFKFYDIGKSVTLYG